MARPMITVRDLNFTYPGANNPVLMGLEFNVAQGEVFGFLGPSGAGKSTTQKILIKLLHGYEGDISVMDRPLDSWSADYYECVGVSFERPNHFLKLTAKENLDYFRQLYRGDSEDPLDLLAAFGLQDDANRRVAQYSKGMQVRLNVARSLINKPRLLFLDEPTAGLDPVNAKIVQEKIRELSNAGTTIFLTTHDMRVADEVCDRVAFIVGGEIRLIDSPRELKLKHGVREVRVEYGSGDQLAQCSVPLDGLAENDEFLELIRRNDIQTIHTQETTLEKIFIDVTGTTL